MDHFLKKINALVSQGLTPEEARVLVLGTCDFFVDFDGTTSVITKRDDELDFVYGMLSSAMELEGRKPKPAKPVVMDVDGQSVTVSAVDDDVIGFLNSVIGAGGNVVIVTARHESSRKNTADLLERLGLIPTGFLFTGGKRATKIDAIVQASYPDEKVVHYGNGPKRTVAQRFGRSVVFIDDESHNIEAAASSSKFDVGDTYTVIRYTGMSTLN
jgi:hypothetical protein